MKKRRQTSRLFSGPHLCAICQYHLPMPLLRNRRTGDKVELVKIEKMSLAVLGVSRDQIMGNSGHLTRIFFRTTSRPADLPKHHQKIQKNNCSGFPIFPVFTVFPAQKNEKRSPEILLVQLLRAF